MQPSSVHWRLGLLLLAAGALAYANCFAGVFTFDDFDSILNNSTIRHLGQVSAWIRPPGGGITVSSRPAVNFSLALNWAWSGRQVWSYHVINLVGHLSAGLILFGLARRTLTRIPALEAAATGLAWTIALLWTLHPLQTESVTYVVQRAEMLMGLCYLGALLCFVRSVESDEASRPMAAAVWAGGCAMVCFVGMLCKEVMVSAPVILLLYDRTFVSGNFGAAWRRRRGFWLILPLAWIPLLLETVGGNSRGGTAGFGSRVGVNLGQYLWTQGPAIMRYLSLTVWPHPLVLDHGFERRWIVHPWAALPANLAVGVLAAGTIIALWRAPCWGFLGFWFFAVLAPTSLIPGGRQSLAEHRMYLALAPVIAALVVVAWQIIRERPKAVRWVCAAGAGIAVAEGAAVRARNEDYRSDEGMWRTAVYAVPDNAYAHKNLGDALSFEGKWLDARAELLRSTQLDPDYAAAENNLGLTYHATGEEEDAIRHFRRAVQLDPRYASAFNNLGVALGAEGRWGEAAAASATAFHSTPYLREAELNLGVAERNLKQFRPAEEHLRHALTVDHDDPQAWYELGLTFQLQKKANEAVQAFAEALRLRPKFANAQVNWAAVLVMQNKPQEAISHFGAALALDPTNADVLINRGFVFESQGKTREAAADYQEAIRVRPSAAPAWANLAMIRLREQRVTEAVNELKEAVRLDPTSAQIHYDYALALAAAGNRTAAVREDLETLRLAPDLTEPRNNLATQYAAAGEVARACDELTELVRRHPDYIPAHLNLAQIFRATGREADAQRELDRTEQLRAEAAK